MSQTILCVDDDRGFCNIMARALSEQGYTVETAHDGATAVERCRTLEPSLVTLDVLLPRRDGFQVLEAIRGGECGRRDLPVFLFSGCTPTPTYEKRAADLRADALLRKPLPLEDLVQVVQKQLGEAPATSAHSGSRGLRPMLEGSLADLPVSALLHHLHGLRATGVLEVQARKKRKQIQLREGRVVAIRSNLVNETLGHLLVASGTITWDVLHESVRRVRLGEGLQGQILVAMQMLDEDALARALRTQAEEKLFEAFAWRRGNYRFHKGAHVRGANTLSLNRGTADVILEGVRDRMPLDLVDAFLEPREHLCPVPGESPYYRFQELTLDEAEQALLVRLEQAPTIRSLYPLGEADRRALYSLVLLERVELREGLATQRVAKPTRAAPSIATRAVESPPQESPEDGRIREELARMAARLRDCDAFEVLDVPRETDDETVRSAYTALAKRTHPDRFAGSSEPVARLAEDVFARVSEAYELVRDRDSRLHYMRDQVSREREQAELEEGHRALRAELAFQAGEGALRARRYAEAASQFEKAMEAYPEEGEYRAWYGYAYWLEAPEFPGRLEQALRHVQAGRKLAPDREKPYLFLGRLLKAADRPKQAEKMFTRAVQLAPDCVEALRELRLIHMRREKSKGIVQRILRR